MSEKIECKKERAFGVLFDAIHEALMNEEITIDELVESINDMLPYYVKLGKRLTPKKTCKVGVSP